MAFWAPIEAAIAAWVASATGLPAASCLWANQRQALPCRPYITLKRGSLRDLAGPGGELSHSTDADVSVAIAGWISGRLYTEGAQVVRSGQVYLAAVGGTSGATGPTGTGERITDGTVVWTWQRPAAAGTRFLVTGRFEFTVSVQAFASATAGDAQRTLTSSWERTAGDYLNDVQLALAKPSVLDTLSAAGLACHGCTAVRDLPDDRAGAWISRSQFDVTFSVVKSLTDFASFIDTVSGQLELGDDVETFSTPAP